MSLKAFHIIFVAACVALSLFVALWGVRQYSGTGSTTALILALVFFPTAGVLVVYGKKVFRKLKELP
ncbi:MAG TPA: hypothetical protein VMS98_02425 [Thermoanaerobaculia bacterium]|nr:hypothetical protein [Thermoanaerobaculia bacterium]